MITNCNKDKTIESSDDGSGAEDDDSELRDKFKARKFALLLKHDEIPKDVVDLYQQVFIIQVIHTRTL